MKKHPGFVFRQRQPPPIAVGLLLAVSASALLAAPVYGWSAGMQWLTQPGEVSFWMFFTAGLLVQLDRWRSARPIEIGELVGITAGTLICVAALYFVPHYPA